MARIDIEDVSKIYGKVSVMEGMNLQIADGEFVVLLGPSGCGKSTLLRMVAGLEDVSNGRILFDGQRVDTMPTQKRNIAMVFQNYALYPHMSVRDNLGYGLKIAGTDKAAIDAKVNAAAATLGLTEYLDRKPRALSGGQRQRVAMGRSIVREPVAFLFDEPLSNLDAKLRGQMRHEIRQLQKLLKTTALYVTHDQVEAMTLADRVVVLNKGKIEQIARPMDLYAKPASVFVADFVGTNPMNLLPAEFDTVGNLRIHSLTWPVPADLPADLRKPGSKVILGIRPEHIEVTPGGNLPVSYVEPLGSDTVFRVGLSDDVHLVVRANPTLGISEGDRISVSANPADLHIFDATTTRRLNA